MAVDAEKTYCSSSRETVFFPLQPHSQATSLDGHAATMVIFDLHAFLSVIHDTLLTLEPLYPHGVFFCSVPL